MNKMHNIVVCGEKRIAELCLEYLYERNDTRICAIIASPKDWQADLIAWGSERRIKVFVGNINDYRDELSRMALEFIFSFQYRPLVKPPILSLPSRGCVNLHFGQLPRYGGCYPIAWAILNGEKRAGATLHTMSETFDEGDIISQVTTAFSTETTARELFDIMTQSAFTLFRDTYPSLIDGSFVPQHQDLTKKLYYTKDSIDFARDSWINWQLPGKEIQRRICAFTFEPFQHPCTFMLLPDGSRIKVFISKTKIPLATNPIIPLATYGQVVAAEDGRTVLVATGDSDLLEIGMINDKEAVEFIASLEAATVDIRFSSEQKYLKD